MRTINRRQFLGGTAASVLALGTYLPIQSALAGQATPAASPVASGVSPSALEDLRTRLHGTLMLPGDSGYASASAPANGRYADILPVAVARCADEADVVTCIAWCNENGVPPVGRGGGHSYAGFSTTTGLMIDLRRLNSVVVDRDSATVTCGGAALNRDFFIATENGPLFLPGGTCLGVGMGGLTLGGGIGYNTHWAGLTCDHLTASRIVTANAEVLDIAESTVDPTTNDLFWASRGGAGGSFGINTSFTFNMVDVPQHPVSFYRFEWMGEEAAAEVISTFHQVLASAPAALNAVVMAEATDRETDPRAAIHTMTRGQYIGPVDELRELIEPLNSIGGKTTDYREELSFWDIQRMIASEEPPQHNFGDMSRYALEPIADDVVANIVDLVAECPHRSDDANGSFWSLGWVGGDVVSQFGRTDTAYVHRDAFSLLRPTTVWPTDAPASVGNELNAWTAAVISLITPHTPDESYQNFPNRDLERWETQYYAENLDRLVEIKTAVDPANLFNNPQSVPTNDMLAAKRRSTNA
jgi:FAD/FMN-containing dehydrogenase